MVLRHVFTRFVSVVSHICVNVPDCPQVQCVEPYVAQQADELTLEPTEIINVLRKTEGENVGRNQRVVFLFIRPSQARKDHKRFFFHIKELCS